MDQDDYVAIVSYLKHGPDGKLKTAIEKLFNEQGALLDRIVELGGKELARQYWEEWANDQTE